MKYQSYIIFTLILLGSAEFKREFNIIQLSSENIHEVIEKFQYTFIKFYASFCQHCKDLEPDFKAVAAEFQMNQEDESQIALAEIDCIAEAQTCEEFKIEGFPTMQLFASDQSHFIQYNGETDGNSIFMWLNSAMKVHVQELNTQEDVKRWVDQANSYIGVIFFAVSQDDPLLEIYKNYASKNRKFSFASTLNIKCRDYYNISVNSNVVLFKSTEPKQISFLGELNEVTLKDWLDAIELPKVVPIESAIEMIFEEKKSVLLLFINGIEENQMALNTFSEIQKNMEKPDDLGFVFVDIHNPAFDELSQFIGVDPSKLPLVALFEPDNNFNKYHFNQELNLKNIQQFYRQIKERTLQPYIRSQAIPLTNNQKVKVVVTDNFQELVINQKQDIVLVYYAPWCNICITFLKVYEEVAELLGLNPNIIFAKIDATSNDIDFYDLQAYPTIVFYVNGSKNDPVLFESDINSEEITDYLVGFLQSKTSYPWKIRDDNPMNTKAFDIEDLIELVDDDL